MSGKHPRRIGPVAPRKLGRTFAVLVGIETDDCILWPHYLSGGYGRVGHGGLEIGVHQLACLWRNGPQPSPAHEVAHSCGVRNCMNYRHLRWATRAENCADTKLHGRAHAGESHVLRKLSAEQVREIRQLRAQEGLSFQKIGDRFGVGYSCARSAAIGESWKSVA